MRARSIFSSSCVVVRAWCLVSAALLLAAAQGGRARCVRCAVRCACACYSPVAAADAGRRCVRSGSRGAWRAGPAQCERGGCVRARWVQRRGGSSCFSLLTVLGKAVCYRDVALYVGIGRTYVLICCALEIHGCCTISAATELPHGCDTAKGPWAVGAPLWWSDLAVSPRSASPATWTWTVARKPKGDSPLLLLLCCFLLHGDDELNIDPPTPCQ